MILVDKPRGLTSHDVVARLRRALGTRRVGHAGTLDPMATGLLLMGVESATKLLTYLVGLDKEYTATIRLGQATTTDDADGEPIADVGIATSVTDAALAAAIADLTGTIQQVPSSVSAIKVDGVRSYQRVREGEPVELAAREVTVSTFDVLERRGTSAGFLDLDVRIDVSSGTYVRALARDLGSALGVGGHLTALRRTRVGPFHVADAVAVPAEGPADAVALQRGLRGPAEVAGALYPTHVLDEPRVRALAYGQRVDVEAPDAPIVALLTPDGRLAGLASVSRGRVRSIYSPPTQEVLA